MSDQGRPVSFSAIEESTHKVFPNDLNSNDTVFGGMVMATIDRLSLVVAERHSGLTCVTASVDAMNFLAAAKRGDILLFSAAVNRAWNSSIEIGIRVIAENHKTREKRHIVSAYLTFVAMDNNGRPTAVPQVIAQTAHEKRRYDEANIRREKRKIDKLERTARRKRYDDEAVIN